jgi:hypothetical protein
VVTATNAHPIASCVLCPSSVEKLYTTYMIMVWVSNGSGVTE